MSTNDTNPEAIVNALKHYEQTIKEANPSSNNLKLISIHLLLSSNKKFRKHSKKQLEKLKRSIKKFGFTMPIIVNENYEIIAGELRLQAAKDLKWSLFL